MKVIRLEAENVKRLRAVEIVPDPEGNLVIIAGKNSQGKTSVLDSIVYALGGQSSIPGKPIRDGEETAHVVLETESYVITRNWTVDSKSYLSVKPKDIDAKLTSPQRILDKLVGDLAFDPLEFSRRSPAEQRDLLVALAALDVESLDEAIAEAFETRRERNAELKAAKARLDGMEKPEIEEAKIEDPAELTAELERILQHNDSLRQKQRVVEESENLTESYREDIDRGLKLVEQAEQLLKERKDAVEDMVKALADQQEHHEKLQKEYEAMPAAIDPAPMRAKIEGIEAANEQARALYRWQAAEEDVVVRKAAADHADEEVSKARKAKADAIAEADLPIEGLGLDEDGITFGGIPFQQLGSAEQLRISMAMAMTLNPELRVVIIKDGSLLDSESMAIINEMAKDKDYQIWVEVVDESGDVGVVIEDGRVRGTAVDEELEDTATAD